MSTNSSYSADLKSVWRTLSRYVSSGGRDWLYVGKAVLASLLALGIAMRLDLPQPRTAMTTVFIVMQPQSGMALAKGLYRFLGTVIGLAMMLLWISLFSQEPVLYLTAVAAWMAICTAGAAHYRDFRSYGFALTGYTAVLVGIPAAQHASDAFMISMTRLAEVSLGILCATAISALVFPQHAGERIVQSMNQRFTDFLSYVENVLTGTVDRRHVEQANARFVAEIVGFEAARAGAILENPDLKSRSGRFARLNAEFMGMSTRLHAIHQVMDRLRAAGSLNVVAAVEPLFLETAFILGRAKDILRTIDRAAYTIDQIGVFRSELAGRIAVSRIEFGDHSAKSILEFDTATELLSSFVDDLDAYMKTYSSLLGSSQGHQGWAGRYVPKTNMVAATVAGLRTAVLMLILGAFWIYTGWPSGGMAVLNGGAICALASSSLQPRKAAFDMACGTAIAALFGLIVMFEIYPKLDGFAQLCVALIPFLVFGAWLTTRRKFAGYGVGYCIYFCFLAGPDNLLNYNPSAYINDSLAVVISMFAVWAAFAVILPTTGRWLPALLLRELRRQVILACKGRLHDLSMRFESRTRDLSWQISGVAGEHSELQGNALSWLFAVLEVGHAVIDLRGEVVQFSSVSAPLRGRQTLADRANRFTDAVASLFAHPSDSKLAQALATNASAMDELTLALQSSAGGHEGRRALQRALTQMHFIRAALLDIRSPIQNNAEEKSKNVGMSR